ncbi:MBL fold metallo-hydrolase [Candidatus Fermentibacteria bacterium]|nr:MBL fold metallo-hydrolase [Candidatus Fermentibacteria bacterium]
MSGKYRVVLLGTGTPNAEPYRAGPSVAVLAGDSSYLVDFGPGVVRRANAAYQSGLEALKPSRLTRAFLTHLHSDHTAGYPDLILTPWILERNQPLLVYGPPGIRRMTDHVLAAYRDEVRERLDGLEPTGEEGYRVAVEEIEPGRVYEDDNVRVDAFSVDHGSWPAFGFRFETDDGTVVVSGDTAPCESLVEAAAGCDLLVHEVYSFQGLKGRPPEWRKYHSSMHTSTVELADIASTCSPGLLAFYHQLFFDVSEKELLDEVRSRYDGEVVSGQDLQVLCSERW